jgi:predicted NAD/FAD-binding protein
VIASHSDRALAMLSDADNRDRAILGAIGHAPNTVYLHRDIRLMPRRKRARASWNFLRRGARGNGGQRCRDHLLDEQSAGHR